MAIEHLDIFCHFDEQRFTQFGSMDCSNWYTINADTGKKKTALYPCMGRKHINTFNRNRLIFGSEPRAIFKTINYSYAIVGTQVIKIDRFWGEQVIGNVPLGGEVWFSWLPVGTTIYGMLTTQTDIYVITESGVTVTMQQVTDPNRPTNPGYVTAMGNRFVVSTRDTPDYHLTQINLGGVFDPNTVFTIPDGGAGFPLVNRASGIIRQLATLHNQLYIFCDFKTDVWSYIPSQIEVAGEIRTFPFKLNTSYNFDFGIFNPYSLSVGFGMMAFLAKNEDGLVSFMVSNGGQPQDISSQAVNVLLENSRQDDGESSFITDDVHGFLYQYENTIFYRVSAGEYKGYKELDIQDNAYSIEYNFSTGKWNRVTELNGERNRIKRHVYFANKHLVTVQGDPAIYQMSGNIYHNELRNPKVDAQHKDAFLRFPIRYTLTTQQIFMEDYAEFATNYIEIDFVFGNRAFYNHEAPFDNTVFIITEDSDPKCPTFVVTEDTSGEDIFIIDEKSTEEDKIFLITEDSDPDDPTYIIDDRKYGEENPIFVIAEDGNTPEFGDNHYYSLFKPYIALYASDDGGITYQSLDVREFSRLGEYRWRMRWYRAGSSRNRCYKVVAVASCPIIPLGAVHSIKRVSGGAN